MSKWNSQEDRRQESGVRMGRENGEEGGKTSTQGCPKCFVVVPSVSDGGS